MFPFNALSLMLSSVKNTTQGKRKKCFGNCFCSTNRSGFHYIFLLFHTGMFQTKWRRPKYGGPQVQYKNLNTPVQKNKYQHKNIYFSTKIFISVPKNLCQSKNIYFSTKIYISIQKYLFQSKKV